MTFREFIDKKIEHYNNALEKNFEYYDRLRYKGVLETLSEVSEDSTIEDLKNMLSKYTEQLENYTGEFFSEYHSTLSDRKRIIKELIKFKEGEYNEKNL
jgi:hypothetical protein